MKIKARRLKSPNVSHISIVERGANRIPFRVMKSEDKGMTIDLTRLWKREKINPSVSAVLVNKSVDLEKAKRLIQKAGFSIEKMEEAQGGFIFPQQTLNGEAATQLVKFDNGIGVQVQMDKEMLEEVQKSFEGFNFQSKSFNEVMAQEGVWPSIHMAKMALGSTIENILADAGSAGEASSMIGKACDDFKKFVTGTVSAVPVEAFKLEAEDEEGEEPSAEAGEEGSEDAAPSAEAADEADADDADDEEEADEGKPEEATKSDDEEAEVGDEEEDPESTEEGADEAAEVAEADGEAESETETVEKSCAGDGMDKKSKKKTSSKDKKPMAEEAKKSTGLTVETLKDALTAALKPLNERLDAVEKSAKQAEALAQGVKKSVDETVLGSTTEDKETGEVSKSDDDFGVIDTALRPIK